LRTLLLLFSFFSLLNAFSVEEKQMFKSGKKLYKQTCISCHGKDGQTNKNIQLIIKPRRLQETILTQEQSFKVIKEGARFWGAHSEFMPAFKPLFNDKQISSIAFYISKAFNPARDQRIQKLLQESKANTLSKKELLKIGAKIFKRNCSHCHGKTGNGKSIYIEKSKTNKLFIYPYNLTRTLLDKNQIFLYAKYGGYFWGADGTHMPSWKKKYNDEELKSVAEYIDKKINR